MIASLSDGRVWFSFAVALLLGALCVLVGTWSARRVGFLDAGAPRGEVLAVGLGSGLLLLAASWAAIFSGGQSAFTPVAMALALAIALDGRLAGSRVAESPINEPARHEATEHSFLKRFVPMAVAGGVFVVLVGLLYGITMAPSPRDGVQPLEFFDEAYYSALGADLARTGIESMHTPSGFEELPGLPAQSWYHWGELWLSAFVITITGIDPVVVRHFIVLPLVLLAAAALTGTLVRRLVATTARGAFLFGAAAALFLAPMPVPGRFFGSWATGLIFGITMYGLGVIAALLAVYVLCVHRSRWRSWGSSLFAAAIVASMLPTHIVIATLAFVGTVSVAMTYTVRSLVLEKRLPTVDVGWWRTLALTAFVSGTTAAWGLITGHGIGISGVSPNVSPFNEAWRESVALTIVGAGVFLAIPAAWFITRRSSAPLPWLFLGTVVVLTVGALAWGARLGDFTMFHVFYGGIAVFGTPAAAVAVWKVSGALRQRGRVRLAAAMVITCAIQMEIGVATGVFRLYNFGAQDHSPVPITFLSEIESLPPDAKLAYSCRPSEEAAFWNPRLISIYAHTGRPVVPMCFETEVLAWLNDAEVSGRDASPLFTWAPQRTLYPTSEARPSLAQIMAFMNDHNIEYIYVDAAHPNELVPGAPLVAKDGDFQLLRAP